MLSGAPRVWFWAPAVLLTTPHVKFGGQGVRVLDIRLPSVDPRGVTQLRTRFISGS